MIFFPKSLIPILLNAFSMPFITPCASAYTSSIDTKLVLIFTKSSPDGSVSRYLAKTASWSIMAALVESSARALMKFAPSTLCFNAAVILRAIKSTNMCSMNAKICGYYLTTMFFKSEKY